MPVKGRLVSNKRLLAEVGHVLDESVDGVVVPRLIYKEDPNLNGTRHSYYSLLPQLEEHTKAVTGSQYLDKENTIVLSPKLTQRGHEKTATICEAHELAHAIDCQNHRDFVRDEERVFRRWQTCFAHWTDGDVSQEQLGEANAERHRYEGLSEGRAFVAGMAVAERVDPETARLFRGLMYVSTEKLEFKVVLGTARLLVSLMEEGRPLSMTLKTLPTYEELLHGDARAYVRRAFQG